MPPPYSDTSAQSRYKHGRESRPPHSRAPRPRASPPPLPQVGMLHSSRWQPHAPVVTSANDQRAVFVSKFPLGGETLWFAINTDKNNRTATLTLSPPPGTTLYDCYRGVSVPGSDSPRASLARPAPSPNSRDRVTEWIKYGDTNCYDRHGARDLETPPGSAAPGSPMLLAACENLCVATQGCTAVTVSSSSVGPGAGNSTLQATITPDQARDDEVQCYRRAQIQIQRCDHGHGYDTYSHGALPPSPAPVLPSPSPYRPPSPAPAPHPGGVNVTVIVPIDAYGIGCFVATRNGTAFDAWYQEQAANAVDEDTRLRRGERVRGQFTQAESNFAEFMVTMHKLVSQGPNLACLDWEFKLLPQMLVAIPHSSTVRPSPPDGMVTVPGGDRGAPPYEFGSAGLEIEQGAGCDLQLPWESSPRVQHNRTLNLTSFHIDKYPVTTAQYAQYVNESGYRPLDPTRW